MSGHVLATYQTTAEEFMAMNAWLQRRVAEDARYNSLGSRLAAAAMTAALVAFFGWAFFTWDIDLAIAGGPVPDSYAWALLLSPALALIVFFIAQMLLMRQRSYAEARQNFIPRITVLKEVGDGLLVENGISPLRLEYSNIERLARLGDGYAVKSGLHAHFIPRRGFKSKDDESGFLALMQQNLKPGTIAGDIHAAA